MDLSNASLENLEAELEKRKQAQSTRITLIGPKEIELFPGKRIEIGDIVALTLNDCGEVIHCETIGANIYA